MCLLSRWSTTKRWEITICQNRRAWAGRKLDHSGMTIWKDTRLPASACHRRRMASVSLVYFLKCFSTFGLLDPNQRCQSSCVPHPHAKSRLGSPYWTTCFIIHERQTHLWRNSQLLDFRSLGFVFQERSVKDFKATTRLPECVCVFKVRQQASKKNKAFGEKLMCLGGDSLCEKSLIG